MKLGECSVLAIGFSGEWSQEQGGVITSLTIFQHYDMENYRVSIKGTVSKILSDPPCKNGND